MALDFGREEVARVEAEESAGRSRVERAGDEAVTPPPAPAPAPGAAADTSDEAAAVLEQLEALPPELMTAILVVGLDLLVPRLASLAGASDEKVARLALPEREQQNLVKVWTPAIKFYSPRLPALLKHPLALPVAMTGLIYGMKTLPPGASLSQLLGGGARGSASGATPENPTPSAGTGGGAGGETLPPARAAVAGVQ